MVCSLNGKLFSQGSECLNPQNSSFRSGFGLIETMLFVKGQIPLWAYHFKRLGDSIRVLGLDNSFLSEEACLKWIQALIEENKIQERCVVRIQYFLEQREVFLLIETSLPENLFNQELQKKEIGIALGINLSQDRFSPLKTTSRFSYEIAKRQAQQAGWYDALLLNQQNRVVETTISNVFWVKNGIVHTPPIAEGCIAGVYRSYLLNNLSDSIKETVLEINSFKNADEIFLTNAVKGIQPIHHFEDRSFEAKVTEELMRELGTLDVR